MQEKFYVILSIGLVSHCIQLLHNLDVFTIVGIRMSSDKSKHEYMEATEDIEKHKKVHIFYSTSCFL